MRSIKEMDKRLDEREQEIEKLQQENKKLKEIVYNLTTMTVCGDRKQIKNTAQYKLELAEQKIDKAIEYIKSIKMVNCKIFDYNRFLKEHLISLEELKKKVEEDGTLEGHFVEVNKDKLLEILGDGNNE